MRVMPPMRYAFCLIPMLMLALHSVPSSSPKVKTIPSDRRTVAAVPEPTFVLNRTDPFESFTALLPLMASRRSYRARAILASFGRCSQKANNDNNNSIAATKSTTTRLLLVGDSNMRMMLKHMVAQVVHAGGDVHRMVFNSNLPASHPEAQRNRWADRRYLMVIPVQGQGQPLQLSLTFRFNDASLDRLRRGVFSTDRKSPLQNSAGGAMKPLRWQPKIRIPSASSSAASLEVDVEFDSVLIYPGLWWPASGRPHWKAEFIGQLQLIARWARTRRNVHVLNYLIHGLHQAFDNDDLYLLHQNVTGVLKDSPVSVVSGRDWCLRQREFPYLIQENNFHISQLMMQVILDVWASTSCS